MNAVNSKSAQGTNPAGPTDVAPILFSRPPWTGNELKYLEEALKSGKVSGDNSFTKKCHQWLEARTGTKRALLTTSGTDALELAALLADIKPGDEVIMPSFTFSSSANAFVLRGAKIVFIDIRPDTMNMDEKLFEAAITPRTRAVVPMHYAGVACEMDQILEIAKRHKLFVIEDAAQAIMASYKGRALGSLGDFGAFSFHDTKNFTAGEGGAILVNRAESADQAEILREKGTNRAQFFRGQVDKYTWHEAGSSFLISDLNAAVLWAQLEQADNIQTRRHEIHAFYTRELSGLARAEKIVLPTLPTGCEHNAHIFYFRTRSSGERDQMLSHLRTRGVLASFHYIPLHSAPAGIKYGRFHGEDKFTTQESSRLVRLPLHGFLTAGETDRVIGAVREFFR